MNTLQLLINTKVDPRIWLDKLLYQAGYVDNYGQATQYINQGIVFINGYKVEKGTQTIDVGEIIHKDVIITVGKRRATLKLDKSFQSKKDLKIIVITREDV